MGMAGTNDLARGRPVQAIVSDIEALHEACHAAGASTVALAIPQSCFCCAGPQCAALDERRREVNAMLRVYASRVTKCTFVPIDEQVPWSPNTPHFEPDGLHLSREGYAEFASKLAVLLAPIIGLGTA